MSKEKKQKEFNAIGKSIVENIEGYEKIFLEQVKHMEYIVVQFRGGAISVRNATGNSNIANMKELSKLLSGGYYDEVREYQRLKEQV